MSTPLRPFGNDVYDALVQIDRRLDAPRPPDRPFESPIEEEFADQLRKHQAEDVEFSNGVEIPTPFSQFRLDLFAKTRRGKIAFECDGKDYHLDKRRDLCRDAIILHLKGADAIYRFRGQDLVYNFHDCLYVILRRDPAFFSDRGTCAVERRASDAVKAVLDPDQVEANPHRCFGYASEASVTVFTHDEERGTQFTTIVERRTLRTVASPGIDHFVAFALAQPKGRSFQAICTEFWGR